MTIDRASGGTDMVLRVEDLDTPAIIVDLDALEQNIRSMQERMNRFGLGSRPVNTWDTCALRVSGRVELVWDVAARGMVREREEACR